MVAAVAVVVVARAREGCEGLDIAAPQRTALYAQYARRVCVVGVHAVPRCVRMMMDIM